MAAVEKILRRSKIFSNFFVQNPGFPPVGTENSKTAQVLKKQEPRISESRQNKAIPDEALIGCLRQSA